MVDLLMVLCWQIYHTSHGSYGSDPPIHRYCHQDVDGLAFFSSISNFRVIPPKSHPGKLRYEIHPDIVAGGLTQAFATYHLQKPVVQGFEVGSFQWSLQCYKL